MASEQPSSGRVRVWTLEAGEIAAESDRLDDQALRVAGDGTVMWIDLVDPDVLTLRLMQRVYGLHPLVVDMVTEHYRTSDVSFFDHATHIVLHFPHLHGDAIGVRELQIIIGERFFITIHRPDAFELDATLGHWRATPNEWRSTSSSLLYAVLRTVVAAFLPVADHLDVALERLEHEAITSGNMRTPRRKLLYELFNVTEQITDVHNMAGPAVEMMQSVEQNSEWFAHRKGTVYSRDVIDDAARLAHRLGLMGDTAGRLFDMVNSLVTLRSMDVSNRLTIVATIFLPLSFLSSYFGQNFAYMIGEVRTGMQFAIWGIAVPLVTLAVILLLLWRVGALR